MDNMKLTIELTEKIYEQFKQLAKKFDCEVEEIFTKLNWDFMCFVKQEQEENVVAVEYEQVGRKEHYFLDCLKCGKTEITKEHYHSQSPFWTCPKCNYVTNYGYVEYPCEVRGCGGHTTDKTDICNICGTYSYQYWLDRQGVI